MGRHITFRGIGPGPLFKIRARYGSRLSGRSATVDARHELGGVAVAYEQIKIRDIVDRAVNHSWSIPEFQRGFVWKATQVRDLAESLWLDYPVGSLLVWNSRGPTRGA